MMSQEEFERLVAEEFPNAIASEFRDVIKNVALLVEAEPSEETRKEEGLHDNETLLGLYRGIPATMRGDFYGVGTTLPDTITLYMKPIFEEAYDEVSVLSRTDILESDERFALAVRKVVRETIWHEVAHHFGFNEAKVRDRERKRDGKK
jgi:predicted Zn-dependent protease with MMP-like domain